MYRFVFTLLLPFLLVLPLQAQSIQINKIEPPNWWAGMKWNTVQVMLYGENLTRAEITFDAPGALVKAVALGREVELVAVFVVALGIEVARAVRPRDEPHAARLDRRR